jgi:hypothetical protein
MGNLQIVISGTNADAAADQLTTVLAEGEALGTVTRVASSQLPESTRKVIEPVSLAAVILAIPGAVLAVFDGVDRIRKRRKARAMIEQAKQLTLDLQVRILIIAADDQAHTLDQLTPDQLLTLAEPDR